MFPQQHLRHLRTLSTPKLTKKTATKSALPQPLKVKVKHFIFSSQIYILKLSDFLAPSDLVFVHLYQLRCLIPCAEQRHPSVQARSKCGYATNRLETNASKNNPKTRPLHHKALLYFLHYFQICTITNIIFLP